MESSAPDVNTTVEKHEPPGVEQNQKQNRQQKKEGKQKIKESEQEEQLKLAKSVINSLERKLDELENSNKLMKQMLNLLKSGGVEEGVIDNRIVDTTGDSDRHIKLTLSEE